MRLLVLFIAVFFPVSALADGPSIAVSVVIPPGGVAPAPAPAYPAPPPAARFGSGVPWRMSLEYPTLSDLEPWHSLPALAGLLFSRPSR